MIIRILIFFLFPLNLCSQVLNRPFLEERKTWITEIPYTFDGDLVTKKSHIAIEGRNFDCLYLTTHPHQNLRNAAPSLFDFATKGMGSDELEEILPTSSQGIWIKLERTTQAFTICKGNPSD